MPSLSALVVDDDPALGDLLVTVLLEAGLDAHLSGTAASALAFLQEHAVDVILLDRDLPGGMDGLSLLEQLREAGDEVNVIIITGVGTVANATRAMELGVSAFLAKPFADIFEVVELARRLALRASERRRRRERRKGTASLKEVTAALRTMTERLEARSSESHAVRAALLALDAGDRELLRHELSAQHAEVLDVESAEECNDETSLVVVAAPLAQLYSLVAKVRERTRAPVLAASTAPDMDLVAKLIRQGVVAFAERPAHDVVGLRKKIGIALRRAREG